MNIETIKLILSVWGAGLSTLLALITILKFHRESRIKLLVISTVEFPFKQLQISAINDGNKPVTITHFFISVGASYNQLTQLIEKNVEIEKRLSESDRWTTTIDRDELIKSFKKLNLKHRPFNRLWASVQLSNGKIFHDCVYVSPLIIQREFYSKAEQFITTDLFLGLEQMNSEFYPIGIK